MSDFEQKPGAAEASDFAVTASEAWLPPNPQVLETVISKLKNREYDNGGREQLLKDLKKDLSLYLYCIKMLSNKNSEQVNPAVLLRETPIEEIEKVLDVSASSISLHNFPTIPKIQTLQLQQSVIAATAAQALAGESNVDAELVFSCGVLRQLGMMLIAFNYPHIYKKEISSLKAGESLNRRLAVMIGFSPSLLGVTIAKQWGLIPEVERAIFSQNGPDQETSEIAKTAETLSKLCRIGETLSRALNPSLFPDAEKDWGTVKEQIESQLGATGLKVLEGQITENLKEYMKAFPKKLGEQEEILIERFEEDQAPETINSSHLARKNSYLAHCPEDIKDRLHEFYSRIDGKTASQENIDLFIKLVAPSSGFPRGCIYLLEPETLALIPRLPVGNSNLSEFDSVKSMSVASSLDPVAVAYRSTSPIMEKNNRFKDQILSYAAGSLGHTQRIGVLYLEIQDSYFEDKDTSPLICFKALRQTLVDCMGLY